MLAHIFITTTDKQCPALLDINQTDVNDDKNF